MYLFIKLNIHNKIIKINVKIGKFMKNWVIIVKSIPFKNIFLQLNIKFVSLN